MFPDPGSKGGQWAEDSQKDQQSHSPRMRQAGLRGKAGVEAVLLNKETVGVAAGQG